MITKGSRDKKKKGLESWERWAKLPLPPSSPCMRNRGVKWGEEKKREGERSGRKKRGGGKGF